LATLVFGGVGCGDFCSLRGLGCGYCSSRRCRMWLLLLLLLLLLGVWLLLFCGCRMRLLLLMEVWVVATLSLGGFGEWLILFS